MRVHVFAFFLKPSGFNLNAILDGLGGRENIQTLDNCVTRLRVEVKDSDAVNEGMLKAAGAKAVVRPGAGSVQVVIGLKVQKVADELRKMIETLSNPQQSWGESCTQVAITKATEKNSVVYYVRV